MNVASTPALTTLSSIETTTTTDLPTNVSIESFHISNTNGADKLPTTWQQWLVPAPALAQDQTSTVTNGLFRTFLTLIDSNFFFLIRTRCSLLLHQLGSIS